MLDAHRYNEPLTLQQIEAIENKEHLTQLWSNHSHLKYNNITQNGLKILYLAMNGNRDNCVNSLIMQQQYIICLTYTVIPDISTQTNLKIEINKINNKTTKFMGYLYYPKSTWTQGRNALLLAVVLSELYLGFKFNYIICLDGDVQLNPVCSTKKEQCVCVCVCVFLCVCMCESVFFVGLHLPENSTKKKCYCFDFLDPPLLCLCFF